MPKVGIAGSTIPRTVVARHTPIARRRISSAVRLEAIPWPIARRMRGSGSKEVQATVAARGTAVGWETGEAWEIVAAQVIGAGLEIGAASATGAEQAIVVGQETAVG